MPLIHSTQSHDLENASRAAAAARPARNRPRPWPPAWTCCDCLAIISPPLLSSGDTTCTAQSVLGDSKSDWPAGSSVCHPRTLPRAKAMQHDDEKVDRSRRRGSASETTLGTSANRCVNCSAVSTQQPYQALTKWAADTTSRVIKCIKWIAVVSTTYCPISLGLLRKLSLQETTQ